MNLEVKNQVLSQANLENCTDLTIEHIQDLETLIAYRDDWNRLLETNQTKTVELSYEWQTSFWKHFKENSRLFVLIVRQGEEVIAIAPFHIRQIKKFGIPIRQLEFIASSESNFQDFLIKNHHLEVLECVQKYLITKHHLWDCFSAFHVPEASTTVEFLRKKNSSSLICYTTAIEECIFTVINQSWEDYAQNRSKSTRKKMRQSLNRLQKVGEVETFFCDNHDQLKENLEYFFKLHSKRWNATDTPSQFNDERYRNFYLEVSPKLFDKGEIKLFGLTINKLPVALLYSFLYEKDALFQWSTYDLEYAFGSPSMSLREMFIEQTVNQGIVHSVNFGIHVPYKETWGNQVKNRLNLELYLKKPIPILVLGLTMIKSYLKSIAPLRRLVEKIKTKLYFLNKGNAAEKE